MRNIVYASSACDYQIRLTCLYHPGWMHVTKDNKMRLQLKLAFITIKMAIERYSIPTIQRHASTKNDAVFL